MKQRVFIGNGTEYPRGRAGISAGGGKKAALKKAGEVFYRREREEIIFAKAVFKVEEFSPSYLCLTGGQAYNYLHYKYIMKRNVYES